MRPIITILCVTCVLQGFLDLNFNHAVIDKILDSKETALNFKYSQPLYLIGNRPTASTL